MNNKYTIILFNLFLLLILLLGVEIGMSFLGYKPLAYYLPVETKNELIESDADSVKLLPFFYPDKLGLLKINLKKYDAGESRKYPWSAQLYNYIKDAQLNEDGFRTHSFSNLPANKTKIMFIGDSYVFGYEAQPLTNSFVDLIQKKDSGWCCLNMGVGGADLAGYEAIAKNYIPILKPAIVVCCIYVNDFIYYHKHMKPYQVNDIYLTYEGVLLKENNNYIHNKVQVFDTPNDSYRDLQSKKDFFLSNKKNFITRFLFNHSRIYGAMKTGALHTDIKNIHYQLYDKANNTSLYIQSISKIAKENHAKVVFFLIPDLYQKDKLTEKEIFVRNLDTKEFLYYPDHLSASDYVDVHQHFNNKGYAAYADFVYSVLDTIIR